MWAMGAFCFFYAFFQRVAPSVMGDQLQRELELDGLSVGNLSAAYFYTYAAIQIPIGLLVDRYGPRRLMACGMAICALATAGFALSQDLALAYLCRLTVGFGAGFAFVAAATLAARWFSPGRFSQIVGMTMMLGMAGGAMGQGPLGLAVDSFGWRESLLASALPGLALALAVWLLVRDHPPGSAAPPAADGLAGLGRNLKRVVLRRQNLIIAFLGAAMSAPMLAFAGFWGVAWLMQIHGYTRPEAGTMTSLLLLGWALGAPGGGWLSDRLRRRKAVVQAGCLLTLLTLLPLLYLPELPVWAMATLFLLTGLAAGVMVISFAMARFYNPVEETGAALGLVNAAVTGTGAVFQPFIGFLLDLGWDGTSDRGVRLYDASTFGWAFSCLIVFLALALLLSLLLDEPRTAKKAA